MQGVEEVEGVFPAGTLLAAVEQHRRDGQQDEEGITSVEVDQHRRTAQKTQRRITG